MWASFFSELEPTWRTDARGLHCSTCSLCVYISLAPGRSPCLSRFGAANAYWTLLVLTSDLRRRLLSHTIPEHLVHPESTGRLLVDMMKTIITRGVYLMLRHLLHVSDKHSYAVMLPRTKRYCIHVLYKVRTECGRSRRTKSYFYTKHHCRMHIVTPPPPGTPPRPPSPSPPQEGENPLTSLAWNAQWAPVLMGLGSQ